jgi:exopolysaccharide production protein ExoZ
MLLPHVLLLPPRLAEFCVDLFFVISGFIMWITTIDSGRGPGAFWLARLVRIVPLYWIYTSLYVLVALLVPRVLNSGVLDPVHVISSYLFIPANHPLLGNAAPPLSLGWTLNYEMFFYFFFGLFLFLRNPRLRLALMAVFFLCLIAVGQIVHPQGPMAQTYTDPILIDFVVGVVLAVAYPRLAKMPAALGWALLAISIGWLTVMHSLPELPERFTAHSIPAAIMVPGVLILERLARLRPNAFLLLLGDASYSIYLAHPFAVRACFILMTVLVGTETPTKAIICAVATALAGVVGGLVSWFLLEKPMLGAIWGLIRSRRRRAAENQAADGQPTR